MSDLSLMIESLIIFCREQAPAILGAIITSDRQYCDKGFLAQSIAWFSSNFFSFLLILSMSFYLVNFVQEAYKLSEIQTMFFRLLIGLFGVKLYKSVDSEIDNFFTVVIKGGLVAISKKLGLDKPANKQTKQEKSND